MAVTATFATAGLFITWVLFVGATQDNKAVVTANNFIMILFFYS
jgi:hypothetical protein